MPKPVDSRNTQHASRFTFHVPRSINPIIIKEMRGHIRRSRAFWILTGYLLGLGLLAYGLYRITLAGAASHFGPGVSPQHALVQSAFIGQTLFIGLALVELVFVCLITPALTAGVISGEAERRTYDMLLATPLRPASIVWGKMFASLTYVQLLILAAIPLSSVVFLFGGVALRDVIQVIGLLALTAITYGTLGLFFSALTRRTGRAMALSYGVVLCLVGSQFAWAVTDAVGGQTPPRQILYLNPASALASAVLTQDMLGGIQGTGPTTRLLFLMGGSPDALGLYSVPATTRPLWQYTVVIYLAATVVLYLLTTQLVKPVRRWRIGWRGLIGLLPVAVLLAGGLLFIFGADRGSTNWHGRPTPTPPLLPHEMVAAEHGAEAPIRPTPTPFPTPTPTPTPIPFNASEHEAAMENCLEQCLFPAGETVFCDLPILGSNLETEFFHHAQVYTWAYCRAFRVADGELVPGVGTSAPAFVSLYWESDDVEWQISTCRVGDMDEFPSEIQQRLLEAPYDEAAGEERLRERARQVLLGE